MLPERVESQLETFIHATEHLNCLNVAIDLKKKKQLYWSVKLG